MDVTSVVPVLILGSLAVLGALAGKLLGNQQPTPVRVPVREKPRRR